MNRLFEYALSLPKSFYFCFRCFPLKTAIRFPVLVRYNTVLRNIGRVQLGGGSFGLVTIGFGDVTIFDKAKERTVWNVSGTVFFDGKAHIGHGSRIAVSDKAELRLGTNFACTANMSLICFTKIVFGKDVLISWETMIMDTDFHYIRTLLSR